MDCDICLPIDLDDCAVRWLADFNFFDQVALSSSDRSRLDSYVVDVYFDSRPQSIGPQSVVVIGRIGDVISARWQDCSVKGRSRGKLSNDALPGPSIAGVILPDTNVACSASRVGSGYSQAGYLMAAVEVQGDHPVNRAGDCSKLVGPGPVDVPGELRKILVF